MEQQVHISPRHNKPISLSKDEVGGYRQLARVGIDLNPAHIQAMAECYAMDSAPLAPLSTPSVTTPIQFLQSALPGIVHYATALRAADELVGFTLAGRWEDEEVYQMALEYTGESRPYGDYSNTPLSSWNSNFERRSIVAFEEAMQVGVREEARAARMNLSSADSKRGAAISALEIQRNRIAFYGYNNGLNRTYGILNDPALPAYVPVPNGGGGSPLWALKTYEEKIKDLSDAISSLRTQSKGLVDPKRIPCTLAMSTNVVDYLSAPAQYGNTVQKWINENYPMMRVVSCPEFDSADAGDNVFYLYAERVEETGTDNGRVFDQIVQVKLRTIGVERKAKMYEEVFSNATAGVMLKRPYAIVRRSGV
jgi:hypothetical protein